MIDQVSLLWPVLLGTTVALSRLEAYEKVRLSRHGYARPPVKYALYTE
jgi:hypothetical protein